MNQLSYIHNQTKQEMLNRGMNHSYHIGSIDDVSMSTEPIELWQSKEDQLQSLMSKSHNIVGCDCYDRIKKEK